MSYFAEDLFDPDMKMFKNAMSNFLKASEVWMNAVDSGKETRIRTEERGLQCLP